MNVAWESCEGLPLDLGEQIKARYLFAIADSRLIAALQGDLQAVGYRLVNPRFEWIQDREPHWVDLRHVPGALIPGYYWDDGKSYTLVNDGVERSPDHPMLWATT